MGRWCGTAGPSAEEGLRYAGEPAGGHDDQRHGFDGYSGTTCVAVNFQPFTQAQLKELRDRRKVLAADGRFELFKMTTKYDGKVGREQHHFNDGRTPAG